MPTGTPLRDGDDQLRDAARRVLLRDGPAALTSRAVTNEAGVAKGLLHRRFADFETFLASLIVDGIERLERLGTELQATAGLRTVENNLTDTLTTTLGGDTIALVGLVLSRPALRERLRLTTPTGVPLLTEAQRKISGYLTAERGLGRIDLHADVDQLAQILVGAAYLALADNDPDQDTSLGELVATVTRPVAISDRQQA